MFLNRIGTVVALLTSVVTTPAQSQPPTQQLGVGYADMSGVTGTAATGPSLFYLSGTAAFDGYAATPGEVVPQGMQYLHYYVYGAGFESDPFCLASGPDRLCNIPVTAGAPLSTVIAKIPPSYYFGVKNYVIKSSGLGGICSGWVLSASRNAAAGAYSVGTFSCGVRPPTVTCDVAPQDLRIDVGSVGIGGRAAGTVTGTVACSDRASVRVRTPILLDGRLRMGDSADAPLAVLTINGRSAEQGAVISVATASEFTVSAEVTNTLRAGVFSGSTPLVVEYM
ncbi:Uncharacterised protein [Serratia marcescens]|nr:Uncharacterised protein [Serratia marcescens]CAI1015318.1 Uncharacterised protein [Serratia marcescens]